MKAGHARLQSSFRRRDRWNLSEESQIAQCGVNTVTIFKWCSAVWVNHPFNLRLKLGAPSRPGVMKHWLKAEATSAAVSLSAFWRTPHFFSGNQTRKTLLFVVVPLNLLILFWDAWLRHFPVLGSLNDWRDSVISHHISPRNNPEYHSVPSFGMAITGLLLIPFVGYIKRRLHLLLSRNYSKLGAFLRGSVKIKAERVIMNCNLGRGSGASQKVFATRLFGRQARLGGLWSDHRFC